MSGRTGCSLHEQINPPNGPLLACDTLAAKMIEIRLPRVDNPLLLPVFAAEFQIDQTVPCFASGRRPALKQVRVSDPNRAVKNLFAALAWFVLRLWVAPKQVAAPAPAQSAPEGQEAGLAVFTRMGCGGCHRLAAANSTGPIGPDLDERLPNHTRESLTAQILSPDPTGIMPDDFGERMTDAELTTLVDFLLAVRESR
jgi:mono/diheme cytochrome c family protein